jgi:hypothetical protein
MTTTTSEKVAREHLAPGILSEFPVISSLPAHIQSMTSPINPPQHKLLTIQDLAELLSIPVLTIYQWRSKHTRDRARCASAVT